MSTTSGKQTLVFLGSGPVGLASLEFLHEHFEIEAVITKPDPQSSRAPRLVADYARQHQLPLLQPSNKLELDTLTQAAPFRARLGVVVDYGIIIPQTVISRFELGIINSHFSLLPEWRGADPITFAILSGQAETGVSIMKIVPALDEGDLLAQQRLSIDPHETTATLTDKLVQLSNDLLADVLPKYLDGQIQPYPQDTTQQVTYSRKLEKSDGEIDWNKPAEQLEREIRAYLGWPGSKTEIAGRRVTILEAQANDQSGPLGTFKRDNKHIVAYCKTGSLVITHLKPDGKGAMSAEAFLAGTPNI